ncbi:MAG: DUF2797 domain-containing protein [Sphingobacteriales bacterium]|nr:DUF2797 domain-containing protein [Sphingobacteriales bacterium]
MLLFEGILDKMRATWQEPVQYDFFVGNAFLPVNDWIGKRLSLQFSGAIYCVNCGKKTKKSWGEGFCYPCFIKVPEAAPCILRPELCEAHLHRGRDVAWEISHHLQPHSLYLALSSALKVGITRNTHIPARWLDQGAWKALILAEVPYRRLAGEIEMWLKKNISDKTNWQKMLKNVADNTLNIAEEKKRIAASLPAEWQSYTVDTDTIYTFHYPVLAYPTAVSSIDLEKTPQIEERLMGIKAQYFIFESGKCLNIRKHSGYWVKIEAETV